MANGGRLQNATFPPRAVRVKKERAWIAVPTPKNGQMTEDAYTHRVPNSPILWHELGSVLKVQEKASGPTGHLARAKEPSVACRDR